MALSAVLTDAFVCAVKAASEARTHAVNAELAVKQAVAEDAMVSLIHETETECKRLEEEYATTLIRKSSQHVSTSKEVTLRVTAPPEGGRMVHSSLLPYSEGYCGPGHAHASVGSRAAPPRWCGREGARWG